MDSTGVGASAEWSGSDVDGSDTADQFTIGEVKELDLMIDLTADTDGVRESFAQLREKLKIAKDTASEFETVLLGFVGFAGFAGSAEGGDASGVAGLCECSECVEERLEEEEDGEGIIDAEYRVVDLKLLT